MDFIVLVLVFAVCYCLYEIYEHKKEQKKPNGMEEEQKHRKLIYKKLVELKDKQCELTFKNEMIGQALKFNIVGMVEELDEEWVFLSGGKNKKELGNLIRMTMIQDVKEIK